MDARMSSTPLAVFCLLFIQNAQDCNSKLKDIESKREASIKFSVR